MVKMDKKCLRARTVMRDEPTPWGVLLDCLLVIVGVMLDLCLWPVAIFSGSSEAKGQRNDADGEARQHRHQLVSTKIHLRAHSKAARVDPDMPTPAYSRALPFMVRYRTVLTMAATCKARTQLD